MPDKDTIEQTPELFDQAGPVALEIHPALAPAIQQVQKAPTVQAVQAPVTNQEMISWALVNDRMDAMRELIALKNAEQDREARLDFDRHFSAMQRDYEPVRRSTKGQFGVFADLNSILSAYGPILSAHGFSNSWEEEDIPEKSGWKRIWSLISGYGYTKRSKFDCPPAPAIDGGNKGANLIQLQAIQSSYGKRISFNMNAGVILTDEDRDGSTFEDGVKMGNEIAMIREAKTQKERKNAYVMAISRKDLTDREKVLLSEESKRKAKELHDAGVKE